MYETNAVDIYFVAFEILLGLKPCFVKMFERTWSKIFVAM